MLFQLNDRVLEVPICDIWKSSKSLAEKSKKFSQKLKKMFPKTQMSFREHFFTLKQRSVST